MDDIAAIEKTGGVLKIEPAILDRPKSPGLVPGKVHSDICHIVRTKCSTILTTACRNAFVRASETEEARQR